MKTVVCMLAFVLTLQFGQAQGEQSPAPVLLSVDAGSLNVVRAESKGRVLVLNLWATWCKPCVEEFPEFMKLQREFRNKGLDVIFVSIDEDDAKTKQKVTAFLKRMKVSGRSYIKKAGDDENFINAVNPKWSGALPVTLIYDQHGRFVEMESGSLNLFELEKIVKPLLPN